MDLFNACGHLVGSVSRVTWIVAATAILAAVANVLFSYIRLRHIPGPRWAAFTNLVRRSWVNTGHAHQIHTDLHHKYGTVVRFGPNAVMVSQPKAIEQIYGFLNLLTARSQSEFYDSIMPRMKGGKIPDVFATRDEDVHRLMRRPVANLYSVTNLLRFESLMTSTVQHLFTRLDELFADKGVDLDLFDWIQFFMFDVLGEVTFSRELGCLEKGEDVQDVINDIWLYFKKIAANTQMPWLDYLWRDNPLVPASSKRNSLAEFGAARIRERMSLSEEEKRNVSERDFLSCFINEKAKDHTLPDMFVPTWINSNIVAGADTTSIVASALLYHLLKNPSSLSKLRNELDAAALSEYVSWKESQTLPYLEACVHEATRLHPPFALPFERIVPAGGLRVDGYWIPGGTRVGINPWVLHRTPSLYGPDADCWRPERWLCGEEQKAAMENALLTVWSPFFSMDASNKAGT
ncbi:MAG: hypothetical protein Q9195_004356 [Heterodermia aff. obscurata]